MNNKRVTVWVLGDQLLPEHPALLAARELAPPGDIRVVLVESALRARRLPYHRRKLVLVLSAMRHYAEALRAAGYQVDYRRAPDFLTGLREHVAAWRPSQIITMAAAEYGARRAQQGRLPAALGVAMTVLPNTQMLCGRFDPIPNPQPGKRYVMETFYRAMRRHFGVMMEAGGEPTGGRWNYDEQNRRPLPKGHALPATGGFAPDDVTRQVMAEVAALPHAVGGAEGFDLAVTHAQARAALDEFIHRRLAEFGPYEDAMSSRSRTLFHSLLSPYLNLGLLDPLECVGAAEAAYRQGFAPLPSAEGFIRQVLGWREYVYRRYHQMMPGLHDRDHWQARRELPQFFWTAQTEMNCLRRVIGGVLETGYSHHIERLMVLCNFALLAGIRPREVNDWFFACYSDAYDWVVTPNVIGMGLCADGGVVGTKPYVASAAYINKMSDYCGDCRYQPKARTGEAACPFNFLYWNFLLQFEKELRANPRMGPNVLGLKHLDDAERDRVRRQARKFLETLAGAGGESSRATE